MDKSSISGSDKQHELNPQWFTGHTWAKVVSSDIGTDKQDIYHVHFEHGSRTKLHRHNGSQILIVTEGRGSLVTYDSDRSESGASFSIAVRKTTPLISGDVVFIPAQVLHTHGSVDGSATFSHIAINNHPCGVGEYVTEWYNTKNGMVTDRI